jgi:hypothetical protein
VSRNKRHEARAKEGPRHNGGQKPRHTSALGFRQKLKFNDRQRNEERERGRDGDRNAGAGGHAKARQKDRKQRHKQEAGLDCKQR